jgi:hypothetical protein
MKKKDSPILPTNLFQNATVKEKVMVGAVENTNKKAKKKKENFPEKRQKGGGKINSHFEGMRLSTQEPNRDECGKEEERKIKCVTSRIEYQGGGNDGRHLSTPSDELMGNVSTSLEGENNKITQF